MKKNNLAVLFKIFYREIPGRMIFSLVFTLIVSCMSPFNLFCIQRLIDSIQNNSFDIYSLVLWSCLICFSFLIITSYEQINAGLKLFCEKRLTNIITDKLLQKLCDLDYADYESEKVQDLIHRVGHSPQDSLITAYFSFLQIISKVVSLIGYLCLFAFVNLWYIVAFVCIIAVLLLCDFQSMKQMNNMFMNQSKQEREMKYLGELMYEKRSLTELKAFIAIPYVLQKWTGLTDRVYRERIKTTYKAQGFIVISNIAAILWVVGVNVSLFLFFNQLSLSIGVFVSLFKASFSILASEESLSFQLSVFNDKLLRVQYYNELISYPLEIDDENKKIDLEGLPVRIEFKNVHFTYPGTEKEILSGVSFVLNEHDKVALVGENGCGKSTIVNLLCRLYKPDSGEILICGKPIQEISRHSIRKIFSTVFQDYYNYWLTVRENIALEKIEDRFDDEKIAELIEMEFDKNWEKNLDQPLGKLEDDGRDLSGGEWQKLAFARGLFPDTPYLIFDEPTAAMDAKAEDLLYRTLLLNLKDKGCIVVSHRLAIAKSVDMILVLSQGKIVERGSHNDLLKRDGVYAELWEAQKSLYE